MNGLIKALTCILGVLAVVACLATIGIIGYTMTGGGSAKNKLTSNRADGTISPDNIVVEVEELTSGENVDEATDDNLPVPTAIPDGASTTPAPGAENIVNLAGHVHDYKPEEVIKATCYQAGQIKYTCSCGDTYFTDVMSTGHVADDWEVLRKPTASQDGLRVKKCIYCDEVMAQENIAYASSSADASGTPSAEANHIHQYTSTTEREPTCTLAGLRKYSCTCNNFYTEMIPAAGHVASDWTVAAEATTSQEGTEQRTCVVCGVLLDSRPIPAVQPTPAATTAATASAAPAGTAAGTAAGNAAATATPAVSSTPHVHSYTSYVLKEANCTEKGIRSFICTCGSSRAESIELDLNNHTYRAVVIPATATTQGYTVYTCIRCNFSYFDNYTPTIN